MDREELLKPEHIAPFVQLDYHEVLKRLSIPYFINPNEDEEYLVPPTILFADGDVELEEKLPIPFAYYPSSILLVVNGNLRVAHEHSLAYYVTGDVDVDVLNMNNFQICKGKETIRYFQMVLAEDDNTVTTFPRRNVTAPLFIAWNYDLNGYDISPHTAIFALYEDYMVEPYRSENPLFRDHASYYALKEEYIDEVEYSYENNFVYRTSDMYKAMRNGESIFREGFDVACMPYYRKGVPAFLERMAYKEAFFYFKEVIRISPSMGSAYSYMAQCLDKSGDWASAESYYIKAKELISEKIIYMHEGLDECLAAIAGYKQDPNKKSTQVTWINQSLTDL
ncbi:tetratricopeptide repeat protein [Bacillus horti]|uniref:Tetratricopeptide (TPR) repeat protein n=1 Tax=Caldalkalibacillus horti TaxID=77523 RepID=A0ABT9W405_9BACI|nr:hypothetical protein [Bacillus horti]MDQ0167973.1 tetratricopeptide (TPR) repeat protein [Bacillus horti]